MVNIHRPVDKLLKNSGFAGEVVPQWNTKLLRGDSLDLFADHL